MSLSIKTKVTLLISVLLLVSSAVFLALSLRNFNNFFSRNVNTSFEQTENLLQYEFEALKSSLNNQARLLGMLPLFRAVVETKDSNTIQDATSTYKGKLKLQILDIFDTDGLPILGDFKGISMDMMTFVRSLAVSTPESSVKSQAISVRDNRPVVLAAAPLGTPPEHSGWLVTGRYLDDAFARRIRQQTGLAISFVVNNQIVSSSIPQSKQALLIPQLATMLVDGSGQSEEETFKAKPLIGSEGSMIGHMLVQYPLKHAAADRRAIIQSSVIFACSILLIFLIFAYLFTRQIVNPIIKLKDTAESIIKTKDLSQRADIDGKDEVAVLAKSFNRLLDEVRNYHARVLSTSKLASLGEMAGGIAHEINNPLTIIQGNARRLKSLIEKDNLDTEKMNKIGDKIDSTSLRIAQIITGLRTFSRDSVNEGFQKSKIAKIIEETLPFCESRFRNAAIDLQIGEIDPELELQCRPVQISQVILNLLNNAYDAIKNQENPWIKLDVVEHPNHIRISVTDSGKGIPEEIRDKIFQPLFTTKDVGKGTGLGLSVSAGIVGSHGGKFTIDENCLNTRFNIVLPKYQSEGEQKSA